MQKNFMKNILTFAILLTAFSVVGCGNGLTSLKGKINIDGKPAPMGVCLEFVPSDASQLPCMGGADENGNYEVQFSFQKKGIQPGEYTVRLLPYSGGGSSGMPTLDANGNPIPKPEVENPVAKLPKSYYEKIEVINVPKGGLKKDFDLKSEN
ncbi:MAG: hypothetical protein ACRC2T_18665 [Thermoguttaceae bacterium]